MREHAPKSLCAIKVAPSCQQKNTILRRSDLPLFCKPRTRRPRRDCEQHLRPRPANDSHEQRCRCAQPLPKPSSETPPVFGGKSTKHETGKNLRPPACSVRALSSECEEFPTGQLWKEPWDTCSRQNCFLLQAAKPKSGFARRQ